MYRVKQHGMIVGAIALFAVLAMVGVQQARAQQSGQTVDAKVLNSAGTSHEALPGDWLSYGRSLERNTL